MALTTSAVTPSTRRVTAPAIPIWLELLRRAVGDDLAAVDDDRPRTDGVHLFQNVRRENDRLLLAHPPDQVADLVLLIRIQTIGRLVQHQDVRIMNDGLGETGARLYDQ